MRRVTVDIPAEKFIIVNADDFGYYDCVSKGILNAADVGAVTATGIFANSPLLESHLQWLQQHNSLDFGVHLNLTDRSPLTPGLRARLHKWSGRFPSKFVMARWILTNRLTSELVAQELRAQIERCLAAGIKLSFLNSHEHIHMLPPVFRITQELAVEYAIPHVRDSTPDAVSSLAPGPLIRDLALMILGKRNNRLRQVPTLPFLGMAASGKLNLTYLDRAFNKLRPGVYELMCHPGQCGTADETSPDHRAYHDWKGEFDTLTSIEFRSLCHQQNIRLIGYRHTRVVNGQVEAVINSKRKL